VQKWTGIRAIAAGRNHTVALNKYGKVLAVGDNTSSQCNTGDFDEIRIVE
jgi:alpha-tubulin suppressor-like RCC1 family protein